MLFMTWPVSKIVAVQVKLMSERFNHNRVLKETIEGPYSMTKSESDSGGVTHICHIFYTMVVSWQNYVKYLVTKTESDAGGKWGGKFIYVYGIINILVQPIRWKQNIYKKHWLYSVTKTKSDASAVSSSNWYFWIFLSMCQFCKEYFLTWKDRKLEMVKVGRPGSGGGRAFFYSWQCSKISISWQKRIGKWKMWKVGGRAVEVVGPRSWKLMRTERWWVRGQKNINLT